ncbi:MAG: FAD-binding protein [Planctomycetaceae bacterium]|nr:MAG: FAD-binding protein [Planctomycetaceae bacterium]
MIQPNSPSNRLPMHPLRSAAGLDRWAAEGVGSPATRDLLVVGAGLAGSAAAIRAAAHGVRVTWVDAASFPRDKVCGCCLNLSALGALAEIGCATIAHDLVTDDLRAWQLTAAGRTIDAKLPGGIAVSRAKLDWALIEQARSRGLQLRTKVQAKVLDVRGTGVDVRLSDESADRRFDAVIWATGLSGGGVSRWLPWVVAPHGPLGVAVLVDDLPGVPERTIRMVCADDGYVGLVRVEDGQVDVAAALRRDAGAGDGEAGGDPKSRLLARVNAILATARLGPLSEHCAERLMTTPPLRRARQCGHGGLLAVGDAAGYVEPFTGEGMAWAIRSGIAAADCVAETDRESDLGRLWCREHARQLRSRQWLCRALSQALASPGGSRWLFRAMALAPWAVRGAVRRLNRV